MHENLKNTIANLPQSPGVYQYYDASGALLYVGKAKKLKNRVQSYFRNNADLTPAKQIMVESIARIEHILTDTETEALLLETNLIKKHKPPYNILLKDDKDWQYIALDYSKTWPEITSIRRPELTHNPQIKTFGPYLSGMAVKDTLRLIKKVFPVCLNPPQKKKNGTLVHRSLGGGGCFNYHINKCMGPCMGTVSQKDYRAMFQGIERFLRGDRKTLIADVTKEMNQLSSQKRFESAARLRDQLRALTKLDERQKMVLSSSDIIDIVSMYRITGSGALNIFRIRSGKVTGRFTTRFVLPETLSDEDALIDVLEDYYSATTDIPKEVIVSDAYTIKSIVDIPVTVAQRGKKAELITLGTTNAKHALEQAQLNLTNTNSPQAQLTALQKALKLPKPISRIETYDISNFQGSFAVGAMVVSIDGEQKNTHYRIFGMKIKQTPDDPFMMYETLTRRLAYLTGKPSTDESLTSTPDLIVIDGGKTQLNAALRALNEARLSIPVISLAKREEEIFIPNRKNSLILLKTDPALKLIQKGRDEAHRFGITRYRKKHGTSLVTSLLNDIPGIGPKTAKTLIKKFGSIQGIQGTTYEDIAKLVGSKKAKIIREYL